MTVWITFKIALGVLFFYSVWIYFLFMHESPFMRIGKLQVNLNKLQLFGFSCEYKLLSVTPPFPRYLVGIEKLDSRQYQHQMSKSVK